MNTWRANFLLELSKFKTKLKNLLHVGSLPVHTRPMKSQKKPVSFQVFIYISTFSTQDQWKIKRNPIPTKFSFISLPVHTRSMKSLKKPVSYQTFTYILTCPYKRTWKVKINFFPTKFLFIFIYIKHIYIITCPYKTNEKSRETLDILNWSVNSLTCNKKT